MLPPFPDNRLFPDKKRKLQVSRLLAREVNVQLYRLDGKPNAASVGSQAQSPGLSALIQLVRGGGVHPYVLHLREGFL